MQCKRLFERKYLVKYNTSVAAATSTCNSSKILTKYPKTSLWSLPLYRYAYIWLLRNWLSESPSLLLIMLSVYFVRNTNSRKQLPSRMLNKIISLFVPVNMEGLHCNFIERRGGGGRANFSLDFNGLGVYVLPIPHGDWVHLVV